MNDDKNVEIETSETTINTPDSINTEPHTNK